MDGVTWEGSILLHQNIFDSTGYLAGFLQMTSNKQFVENVICLVEVEDDVQLTHISEVTIQHLHEQMNLFQNNQLIVVLVHACDEEERSIALVDDFLVLPLNEVAHLRRAREDSCSELTNRPSLLLF